MRSPHRRAISSAYSTTVVGAGDAYNCMSAVSAPNGCDMADLTSAFAIGALPVAEQAGQRAHIAVCAACQRELKNTGLLLDCFAAWPTDVLRPGPSIQARLARRIAPDDSDPFAGLRSWSEPQWEQVAAGIACKLLATDAERHRISMLVRLDPGARYPAHRHAAIEELHLLSGELWIDGRKLVAGDYNVGRPGEADSLVYSETGCTCVLITSTNDSLEA